MSENDDAVLTAAVGYVYTAPPGTKPPSPAQLKTLDLTDTSTWGTGLTVYNSAGHTSRGTLPEFGFEGGESEVVGSWQKKKLREITPEDPIDFLTIVMHQFDEETLGLYYGPNASTTPGVFGVKTGQVNEKAVLVVIEDGPMRLGHHTHKASSRRDASIELPIDGLAALPVRFTYLDHEKELPFTWINEDLFGLSP